MSIQIKHCLVIICDLCGKDPSEFNDEGWSPHFDTIEAAVNQLAGDGDNEWLMTPKEHVCPSCRAERTCALIGHDWGDWWTGDARGIPMSRRGCWRCNESEVRPAL